MIKKILDEIDNSNIFFGFTGLSNQLLLLFSNILKCIKNNKKKMYTNGILIDLLKKNISNLDTILDINSLNILLEKFNLLIIDIFSKQSNDIEIITATYGTDNIYTIVDKKIKELFLKQTFIEIPKTTDLNKIFGDPVPFTKKYLRIKILVNNLVFEICESEICGFLENDIFIDNRINNIKIVNAKYGIDNNYIDVINKVSVYFLKNNYLKILKSTILNDIFGDPIPGLKKKLLIDILFYNEQIRITENEYCGLLENDIIIDNRPKQLENWELLNNIENFDFKHFILNNFKFSQTIYNDANNFIQKMDLDIDNCINVVHLRLEDDAINFWSTKNNMNANEFKTFVENKYCSKNNKIIILSYDINNKVIDYLKKYKYNFLYREKESSNSEYEAAIDMQIGFNCNNNFIGCESSTFTQILNTRIKNKKTILIDYDNVYNKTMILCKKYN